MTEAQKSKVLRVLDLTQHRISAGELNEEVFKSGSRAEGRQLEVSEWVLAIVGAGKWELAKKLRKR